VRRLAILEPLLMFALIMAYIWKLRFIHPYTWIVIPACMILSHVLRRENPETLGFTRQDLWGGLKQLTPPLILIALILVSAGFEWRTFRPIGVAGSALGLAIYIPWGLFQQYALNGYFLNRFETALSARTASIVAGGLFALIHMPNLFLMAVTLPLGWIATLIYRRKRNLYVLGIAHGIIGMLLFVAVPDSLSRHLRIGPGWFTYSAGR
jgi:membrane protease YdiL (CAAX protease family)